MARRVHRQPKTAQGGRKALLAFPRFLVGLVVLAALGISASHDHTHSGSGPFTCPVCQIVDLPAEESDVPESLGTPELLPRLSQPDPNPPPARSESHSLSLPRGPPAAD
jgi:hypothetical protein